MKQVASVIIFKNLIFLDKPFSYELSKEVNVGEFVIVDFNNKLEIGLVVEIEESNNSENLKPILKVIKEIEKLSPLYMKLGQWMRKFYVLTYAKAFGTIANTSNITDLKYGYKTDSSNRDIIDYVNKLNSSSNFSNRENKEIKKLIDSSSIDCQVSYKVIEPDKDEVFNFKKSLNESLKLIKPNATRQWALILEIHDLYYEKGFFTWEDLYKLKNYTKAVFDQLLKRGIYNLGERPEHISPEVKLNAEQEYVANYIKESDYNKFLIHGVTGSGKTEVYFDLIENNLKNDGGSLLLVPEISLTPQMENRIIDRFGDKVSIYHSKLTNKERQTQIEKLYSGKSKILIGTRSAIFVQIPNLKLIIIDEEHDNSYKLDSNNKYDVREVSRFLVENISGAKMVLGTATPAIETYYKARHGVFEIVEIENRFLNTKLPKVITVDMREELKHGNNTPFSMDLMLEMKRALSNNEQVILFLNRRGYAPFVSCRDCGQTLSCDRCDISMVYHNRNNYLNCHYCGAVKPYPKSCPNCKSQNIRHFGMGTEQLEKITKKLFPDHKVYRIDSDTTSSINEYEENIKKIENESVDIILGTQMITKGLDFPNIGLVGVMAADLSLCMPDYEASENTFQLVTQVAGRSGRSEKQGTVVIQTYNPDHYSILSSEKHDYKSFYKNEIKNRRMYHYPPFIRRFMINVIGSVEIDTMKKSKEILNTLEILLAEQKLENDTEILSHVDRLYSKKINNRFYIELIINSRIRTEQKIKRLIYQTLFENKYNLDLKGLHVDLNMR